MEAKFEPNYKKKCIVCGAKPTVDIHPADGGPITQTELCGPCTWGEADCINPDNW